jgi:UDP-GlcNAc3NAcA epimerase
VYTVGDIMKDLVLYSIDNNHITARKKQGDYYYVTLHRPYNTDEKERLMYVLESLSQADKTVVFSIHPRTINAMSKFGLLRENYPKIVFIDPQGYFDNLSYLYFSSGLITDSGGMQKEAYWLKKKCITIRTETEWIETVVDSANTLVFNDLSGLNDIMAMPAKWSDNLYGDGNCGALISSLLLENSTNRN